MMVRKILIIISLIAYCFTAKSQVGELRRDFAFGVNGGVVMDKISFDPTIGQSWKLGSTFGLTARYTCEKCYGMYCAIQAELNYTQMGWKEQLDPSYNINDSYSRTINYFQIPILAHLRFGKEYNGISGFIVLGPQLGFALSESEKMSGDWADQSLWDASSWNAEKGRVSQSVLESRRPNAVVEQYDIKVQNKFDYGITGGAGLEFSNPRFGHISLEGRYYFGLSDIFKNGKTDPFGRSAHGAIYAKATYLFDFKQLKSYRQKKKQAKSSNRVE